MNQDLGVSLAIALLVFVIGMWVGMVIESPTVCPHYKKCKLYKDDSSCCNFTAGFYGDRLATCRVNFEDAQSKHFANKKQ